MAIMVLKGTGLKFGKTEYAPPPSRVLNPFLRFNESTMTWIALHEELPDFQAVLEGVSIFGLKTWTLFNDTKVSILRNYSNYPD